LRHGTREEARRYTGTLPVFLSECLSGPIDSQRALRERVGLKIHPARFPAALPDFFIRLLTDTDDIVLDPFAGTNTFGMVAEKLGRRWVAIEMEEDYLRASKFRFEDID
jgi:DNA modification methylase